MGGKEVKVVRTEITQKAKAASALDRGRAFLMDGWEMSPHLNLK